MVTKPESIQENIPLAPFTTLKIGGPAEFFLAAKTADDVVRALSWAREAEITVTIFGNGANSLISDKGVSGLVIMMQNDQMTWQPPYVTAGAGVKNGQLIGQAMLHGLGGLRWLIGVPGTVGGSIYGNAGGHGWGLGDQVEWVEVAETDGTKRRLSKGESQFAYRTSVFKSKPWIILSAKFVLPVVDKESERLLMAETAKMKNNNQPTTAASAGCMFTNPIVEKNKLPDELQVFVNADGTISAWRLIAHVGLPGRQLGQMQISEKHANFMVNLGGATADQVVQLLSLVKQQVRDKLGVQLYEEVQYKGF